MLNFNKLPEQKEFKKGKFIRPGVQNLILKDVQLQISQNTGNQRPVFLMETEPITDPDWEGFEGALGQIGKVSGNSGYYLKDDSQKERFLENLRDIMKATGVYDSFMGQHSASNFTSLDEVLEAVKPFIVGTKARYFVTAEQYQKLDGSGLGLRLKLPNKFLVESLESASKFPKFDEGNPNHFKKVDKSTNEPSVTEVDGLPF